MALFSPSREETFSLTPNTDSVAELDCLLSSGEANSPAFPSTGTPRENSESMNLHNSNGDIKQTNRDAYSSAGSSAAGKRRLCRLPDYQCTDAARRMRRLLERKELESEKIKSLKFFSINIDKALTNMQIVIKHIQSYKTSRQLNDMARGVTLSDTEPE
eukprot:3590220-Rhodomonas_salina.1